MSSPGTRNTVGKVGVRVVPDTTKFFGEVKKYLESIEKDLKVTVRVEFNEGQALAELNKLKRVLEENAEITIGVRIDQRGINRASSGIQQMVNPLQSIDESFQRVARSVTQLGNNIVNVRQRLAGSISDLAFWVRYTLQTRLNSASIASAWQRLQKAASQVGATLRKIPELASMARDLALSAANATKLRAVRLGNFVKDLGDAQTYANAFYRSMEFVGESAERVANRVKNFKLSDLTNALATGFRRIGTLAASAGRSITRNLGKATDTAVRGVTRGLSAGISALGTAIGKTGSVLGSFGSSLMDITRTGWIFIAVLGLAAPLVGVLAAAIAALPGILAVAAAGIGVVMLGLDGIKAAAKTAQPAFDALKKAVSNTFQSELTPVFKNIAQVLLPGITKGTQAVAKGISDMAKGFFDVASSREGMAQINGILGNIAKFFSAMRPAIAEVTKWFLTLAEVGTGNLQNTAAAIGTFFKNFNQIVQSAKETGVLQKALAGLGQVLGAVGGLFLVLFEAGLKAMSVLGGPMAGFIQQIGLFLGALMPILTVISKLFFDVGSALLSALVPAITALTPAIQLFGEMLGTFLAGAIQALIPIITPLAQIIGTVFLTALQALQPILPPIIQFLSQMGVIIGGTLLSVFTAIQPLIALFAKLITDVLTALTPLMPVITELVSAILQEFLNILIALMPTIIELAELVFPILLDVINALVPVFKDIVNAILPILPELTDLALLISDMVIPFMELLMDVVDQVWPHIKQIIEGALQVIKGIVQLVMGIITGNWEQAWEGIKNILQGAWNMIKGAVSAGVEAVIAFFKGLPRKALDALGALGSYLYEAGSSLVNGLWNGIKAVWNKVTGWIKSALQGIRDLFPFSPAKEGPFSGKGYTLYSGRALAEDWATGIRQGIPEAQAAVEELMAKSDVAASEWSGVIASDGFGSIGDKVAMALEGWGVQIDGNGLAKLVNKANFRKDRRG